MSQLRHLANKTGVVNDAYWLVSEFLMRERLAKIGIMASDLKELSQEKAMAFLTISHTLDKIEHERQEQAQKQASRRSRSGG